MPLFKKKNPKPLEIERPRPSPSSEAKSKRVLVVGSHRHSHVKCVAWDEAQWPNVADFDVVVLNTVTLHPTLENAAAKAGRMVDKESALAQWRILQSNLGNLRSGLSTLLQSKGDVVAFCPPRQQVELRNGSGSPEFRYLSNYSWSPFPIHVEDETGETLECIDADFDDYLKRVRTWRVLLSLFPDKIIADHKSLGPDSFAKYWQQPIAVNRYGGEVASRFGFHIHKAVYSVEPSGYTWVSPEKVPGPVVQESGTLTLLPYTTEISDRDAVNWILEHRLGLQQATLPPEWVEAVEIPGIAEMDRTAVAGRAKIAEIESEIGELERQKTELAQCRQLLFETGDRLESICKQTLGVLGCTVLPGRPKQEDIIIEYNGQRAVIEVKGNTRSASLDDVRQLSGYVEDYRYGGNEPEMRGILLANPWRLHPVEERGSHNKPLFPNDVVRFAADRDLALVSTVALFNAYCAVLAGTAEPRQILERMFARNGVVGFLHGDEARTNGPHQATT